MIRHTTYTSGREEHEAIYVAWSDVEAILGRTHSGDPGDDAEIIAALRKEGAPSWIESAEGWVDEGGWGLIGPEVAARLHDAGLER